MIDPTINIGNMIEIVSIVGGIGAMFIKWNNNMVKININMTGMQEEIKKITTIMTNLAVQTSRLDTISERLSTLDKRYDELRRGVGWIDSKHRA